MSELNKEVGVFIYFIKNALKISKIYPLVVLLASVLNAIFPFIAIVFPRYIIDELMGQQRIDVLVKLILMAAVTALVVNFFGKTCERYLNVKYEAIVNEFEAKTATLLSSVPYEQLESPAFIDLKERAMFPINTRGVLRTFFSDIPEIVKNIIVLVGAFAVIASFDPIVTILILVVIAISTYFNARFQKKDIQLQKGTLKANKILNYNISLIKNRDIAKDVRLNNLSGFLMTKVREFDYHVLNTYAKDLYMTRHFYEGIRSFFISAQNFVVYAYIGVLAIQRSISIGNFSMYIAAATTFATATSKTLNLFVEMRQNCRWLEDYVALNRTPIERDMGKKLAVSTENLEVEFKNVSFQYPKTEKLVLKNINLKIKNGEIISIVGKNGAGKTTFIKLLARLYKPTFGEILLNGININDIDYNTYMKLLSVIFQDFKIFDLTIGENVGFDNRVENRINHSLDQAGVLDFVNSLNEKNDTYIGKSCSKNGTFISGGQMQKLAIARTIYKDSPIIVLDEPTASLDPIAEAEIYMKFNEIIESKTAVYISHRLSSCKFCDRIVLIDEGEIKDEGSHEQLMQLDAVYAEMFNLQAKSYKKQAVC